MDKFSQIVYERPEVKQVRNSIKAQTKAIKLAVNYSEARSAFLRYNDILRNVETAYSIALIRNNIDTSDKFYEAELAFLDRQVALLTPLLKGIKCAVLKSKFVSDFEQEYGSMLINNYRLSIETDSIFNIPLLIKESILTQKYTKTVARAKTIFDGKECNFYALLKQMQSSSREVRKASYEAFAGLYERLSGDLEDIYLKLTSLRRKQARNCHYNNPIDFYYAKRGRVDYTQADVAKFREQVLREVTPLCDALYREQAKRINVDSIKFYDETLLFLDGNADPIGDKDYLVQKTLQMYSELSDETKEFFTFMYDAQLFDLETKPNKRMGGYCTSLPAYNAPFIFSNFNGTSADIQVLTHEAGHCFNAYLRMRNNPIMDTASSTSEINEIHSMSMETFTYPYWEGYFGDKTAEAKYSHLVVSLYTMPYMCVVDEFQHEVFASKGRLDGAKLRAIWQTIERKYMPWRDYDGNQFLQSGGFWMQKLHIFCYPFYYIDYALARIGAFEFYGRSKESYQDAWNDYVKLCSAGGTLPYKELLRLANLSYPFDEGAVKRAIDYVRPDVTSQG